MRDLDQLYRDEGWGELAEKALGIRPQDVESQAREIARYAAKEIARLQAIIDSRPAINAALPQSYIDWSQSIYVLEAECAVGAPQ